LIASVAAAWVWVPASNAFRIRHVEITGTSAVGDLEVRERIDRSLAGKTVFTVDEDALAATVEELPFVESVRVERHLPGGLELHVTEYRPLALAYGDGEFWLVAHDGRILGKARRSEWAGRIPTVTIRSDDLKPGTRVADEPSLQLLSSRSSDSILAFDVIRSSTHSLVATLVDGVEVRFGRPVELRQKVLVAERLMRDAARKDADLLYLDVTVPAKPAWCMRTNIACTLPRGPRDESSSDEGAATTPEEQGGDEVAPDEAIG
jgi:cell division septal protein FtsQ